MYVITKIHNELRYTHVVCILPNQVQAHAYVRDMNAKEYQSGNNFDYQMWAIDLNWYDGEKLLGSENL